MRKRNCCLAFIILILIAGLIPWIDGVLFKRNYLHLIHTINNENRVNIEIIHYNQGWFHSTAQIRLTIVNSVWPNKNADNSDANADLLKPITFMINEEIDHGPIVFNRIKKTLQLGYANIQSDIHLSEELETSLFGDLKSTGIMQFGVLAAFNGEWYGDIHMSSLSLTLQNIGMVTWDGLSGEFRITERDSRITHIVVNTRIEDVNIVNKLKNTNVSSIAIKPIFYSYNSVHEKFGLWSGSVYLSTAGLSVTNQDGSKYVLDQFELSSSYGMSTGFLYNLNFNLNIKNIQTPSPLFSNLNAFHFMISPNNFSLEGINAFAKSLKNKPSTQIQTVDIKQLTDLLIHTVTSTSVIYGQLSFNSPMGPAISSFKMLWSADSALATSIQDVINNAFTKIDIQVAGPIVLKYIENYRAKAMAQRATDISLQETPSIDKEIFSPIAHTPEQNVADLVKIGYMTKENDHYLLTLTSENGVWKVNGRDLYLPKTPAGVKPGKAGAVTTPKSP